MILFCDTSALMKLYAQQQHSDWTRKQVTSASRCIVSQITWVEMCSAFGLKERTGQIHAPEVKAALARLRLEWPMYFRLALDTPLLNTAGELAVSFGLRAYDSVQLASAQKTYLQLGQNMRFCCFDKQLNTAVQTLGLPLLEP